MSAETLGFVVGKVIDRGQINSFTALEMVNAVGTNQDPEEFALVKHVDDLIKAHKLDADPIAAKIIGSLKKRGITTFTSLARLLIQSTGVMMMTSFSGLALAAQTKGISIPVALLLGAGLVGADVRVTSKQMKAD